MKLFATLLLTLTAFAAQVAAADDALVATLAANKVVRAADGSEQVAPADAVKPDDVVEYRTTYRNRSAKTLRGVAATLPVPEGFQYIPGTGGAKVFASLDGVNYAPVPLTRLVKLPNGHSQVEEVPAHEYRFLRWQLGDLAAGTAKDVSARMRLADAPAAVAQGK